MKIIYKDNNDRIMNEVEFEDDEYYSKVFEFKENYRVKEFYENGLLTKLIIFKNADESHTKLVNQQVKNGVKVTIGERKNVGIFKHEKLFHYDLNGKLADISNMVFDAENNIISSSFTYDLDEETPYWNGTSKYYYDTSIRKDDSLFECYYDDDGKLIPITIDIEELHLGDHDGTWIYNNEEGINELMRIFKMSRELAEFYVSSDIIPKLNAV
jgi:hypothetical protein